MLESCGLMSREGHEEQTAAKEKGESISPVSYKNSMANVIGSKVKAEPPGLDDGCA